MKEGKADRVGGNARQRCVLVGDQLQSDATGSSGALIAPELICFDKGARLGPLSVIGCPQAACPIAGG